MLPAMLQESHSTALAHNTCRKKGCFFITRMLASTQCCKHHRGTSDTTRDTKHHTHRTRRTHPPSYSTKTYRSQAGGGGEGRTDARAGHTGRPEPGRCRASAPLGVLNCREGVRKFGGKQGRKKDKTRQEERDRRDMRAGAGTFRSDVSDVM